MPPRPTPTETDEAVVWDTLTRRQQTDLWRLVLTWVADKRQIGFPEYFEEQRQSKSLLGVVARRLWSR